jgi:hypothetical protein
MMQLLLYGKMEKMKQYKEDILMAKEQALMVKEDLMEKISIFSKMEKIMKK